MNAKTHDFHGFFMAFTMKIEFGPNYTIIFIMHAY